MGTTFNVENNILSIKSTFRNAQEINIIWMDRYINRQIEIQIDRKIGTLSKMHQDSTQYVDKHCVSERARFCSMTLSFPYHPTINRQFWQRSKRERSLSIFEAFKIYFNSIFFLFEKKVENILPQIGI